MADKNSNSRFLSLNHITFPLFPFFFFSHRRNLIERPDLEGFYWVVKKRWFSHDYTTYQKIYRWEKFGVF